ncbi:MAG: flavin reductase family protein [Treponema sp.]|nr:flavin reductase family protein [Treponema sp.]
MDNKALYNLSYGLFILGTNAEGKLNACVTDTCIQVASNPVRIAVSCQNANLTCSMIKQSKSFALSILDTNCSLETIRHFGYQSGRNVSKFENISYQKDADGNPYLTDQTCAVLNAHVISIQDLGSHTLFIAEVTDAKLLNSNKPITYADYQNGIKPKENMNQ